MSHGFSITFHHLQVQAGVFLVVLVASAPAAASWIFPDQKQAAPSSRDTEGVSADLNLLTLVSGQSPPAAAHDGLALLRHLLHAKNNNNKVPRSLDAHTPSLSPPSGVTVHHGSLLPLQFKPSPSSQSCCTGSGFKPSTYLLSPANGLGGAAPYKHAITTTTTHKPLHTINAINIYRPVFNSIITTQKPEYIYVDDLTQPPLSYSTTAAPQAYNSFVNLITTSTPTHNSNYVTTNPPYKPTTTTTTTTTFKPPSSHNQISYELPDKYKPTSTVHRQISTSIQQNLPHRDHHNHHHAASTSKPQRQSRGYRYGYEVNSQHHGTSFGHHERSDGNTVQGEYRVQLPDGRLQVVTYTADGERGFRSVVRYEQGR
ncbi:uncharacterized protein LOC123511797 [Portunus trituberculatus]|uniref:uncharacterized protein LOC123511797 n=1 Tax=Portunus trituberculatus TaxID=210409 RepID=UPI001E1CF21A|nr:uncharacterized protein LOC123511797 [Portunus trituberculatus]